MAFLQQISGFGSLERSSPSISIGSSLRRRNGCVFDGRGIAYSGSRAKGGRLVLRVVAMSSSSPFMMNLNEYMVTLEKPLGIRFALSADGKIFVHAIKKVTPWFALLQGEDVLLVGGFTGNWKEPIKAMHKGGPRFETEVRLSQGKYYYKYIINGDWRHSSTSPTERDDRGNTNNIIEVGDVANVRPTIQQPRKDANIIKVIERVLTESERFRLAKAARCIAFSVCPIRICPK